MDAVPSASDLPLDCPQAKAKLEAELLGTASVRIENGQLPPPPVDASEHEVMLMTSDYMLIASLIESEHEVMMMTSDWHSLRVS